MPLGAGITRDCNQPTAADRVQPKDLRSTSNSEPRYAVEIAAVLTAKNLLLRFESR
jgi:hypothetical protein